MSPTMESRSRGSGVIGWRVALGLFSTNHRAVLLLLCLLSDVQCKEVNACVYLDEAYCNHGVTRPGSVPCVTFTCSTRSNAKKCTAQHRSQQLN